MCLPGRVSVTLQHVHRPSKSPEQPCARYVIRVFFSLEIPGKTEISFQRSTDKNNDIGQNRKRMKRRDIYVDKLLLPVVASTGSCARHPA